MGIMRKVKRRISRMALKKEKVGVPVLYGSLLEGRVAIVTGGTSGIGLAVATALARNGAAVCITGRDWGRINAALERVRMEAGGCLAGVVLDSSTVDISAFPRALAEAEDLLGAPLDILVNNAGVIAGGSIPDGDIDGFDLAIDTNLRGAYFLSQAFARRLVAAARSGNILNVCSSSSLRPAISPYALSKWGLRGLTLGLAKQLVSRGITVNGIAPGPTATPMLMPDGDGNLTHDRVPAGRYCTAEEVADMAVVLVSGIGRMVVGDIVYMTGGSGTVTFDDVGYGFQL